MYALTTHVTELRDAYTNDQYTDVGLGTCAQAPKATLRLIFLNAFKMGVTAALVADALKLQS